jgi:ABC-type lipoprotein release transport system permease subunit
MVNRYSKSKKSEIEPMAVLSLIVVLCVATFIVVDIASSSTAAPVTEKTVGYKLRVTLNSTAYNLTGMMTFQNSSGIIENLPMYNNVSSISSKTYIGSYQLSFNGNGIAFGPLSFTVVEAGIVFTQTANGIDIEVYAIAT